MLTQVWKSQPVPGNEKRREWEYRVLVLSDKFESEYQKRAEILEGPKENYQW